MQTQTYLTLEDHKHNSTQFTHIFKSVNNEYICTVKSLTYKTTDGQWIELLYKPEPAKKQSKYVIEFGVRQNEGSSLAPHR